MSAPEAKFMYLICPYEGCETVIAASFSRHELRGDLKLHEPDWPGCAVEVCKLTPGSAEAGNPSYEHDRWATPSEFKGGSGEDR